MPSRRRSTARSLRRHKPMPRAEFFARLGLFVRRDFLDEATCARLCDEMLAADARPATVWEAGEGFVVDRGTRRTSHRSVSESSSSFVEHRLLGLRSDLARHFKVRLTGCRKPGFLAYNLGDFYRPHRDNSGGPGAAHMVRERRVSAVVFLNSGTAAGRAGHYLGGALTFYGLFEDPRLTDRGLPLEADAGLMVAFPSNLVHGVAPVSDGVRCTIVTWFIEAEATPA